MANGGAYPILRRRHIDVRMTPDEHGRFTVLADGYMEQWTIEQIKAAAYDGVSMEQWGDAA